MGVRRSLSDPASKSGSSSLGEQPVRQPGKKEGSSEETQEEPLSSGGGKLWTKEEPPLAQQQGVLYVPPKEEKASLRLHPDCHCSSSILLLFSNRLLSCDKHSLSSSFHSGNATDSCRISTVFLSLSVKKFLNPFLLLRTQLFTF